MIVETRGITWRYYLFSFLSGLTFYTAALVPFYTDWGHISLSQVQFLQAWLMFWAFVLEIPTGVIADKFGRKHSVALGSLMTFLALIVYGAVPNFWAFLLAELFLAAGLALVSGANEALLYESLREEKNEKEFKKRFGRSFSIGQFAAIISAPLGGIIASKYGLNIPMYVTAFPTLIAIIVIMSAKEPILKHKGSESKKYLDIAKKGIASLIGHKTLRSMALNGILVFTGAYFLIWLYQPLLQKLGVGIIYFGFIRATFSLSGMIFSHNLEFTEKFFGSSKKFFNTTAVLTFTPLLLIFIIPNTVTVLLAIVVIGGLGQARFAALNSHMNDHIASEQRATTLSTISMLNRIVLIGLNPVVGFVADYSIRSAFLFVSVLSLLALIFIPIRLSKAKLIK